MKLVVAAALLVAATSGVVAHPCDEDARTHAVALLTLHYNDGSSDEVENLGIDDAVKQLPPIKALKGKGKFDVLEVWGHIYKADYRMRFIYAQIPGSCLLMGQEILEASDPY